VATKLPTLILFTLWNREFDRRLDFSKSDVFELLVAEVMEWVMIDELLFSELTLLIFKKHSMLFNDFWMLPFRSLTPMLSCFSFLLTSFAVSTTAFAFISFFRLEAILFRLFLQFRVLFGISSYGKDIIGSLHSLDSAGVERWLASFASFFNEVQPSIGDGEILKSSIL